MPKFHIQLSEAEYQRFSLLGSYTPKVWPTGAVGELWPCLNRGIRRALKMVDPLIDAEVARITALYEARRDARIAWLARWKADEPRRTLAYAKRYAWEHGEPLENVCEDFGIELS